MTAAVQSFLIFTKVDVVVVVIVVAVSASVSEASILFATAQR